MADFFEDLGKRISEAAETMTKKTEEVMGTQKIKTQIRVLERSNERDFTDIGKMVYERFVEGDDVDVRYLELCNVIESRSEMIEQYRKEIAELKGKELCGNCKGELDPDMAYCPKCGTKVERVVEDDAADEPVEEEAVVAEETTETDAVSEDVFEEEE